MIAIIVALLTGRGVARGRLFLGHWRHGAGNSTRLSMLPIFASSVFSSHTPALRDCVCDDHAWVSSAFPFGLAHLCLVGLYFVMTITVDLMTGMNYGYLLHKPEAASLLSSSRIIARSTFPNAPAGAPFLSPALFALCDL
jgi:hypothetical protein